MTEPRLFTPLTLRGVTFRNRVMVSPMQQYMAGPDGMPNAFHIQHYGRQAIGGAGTLFGPLLGAAVWLFLQDFLQAALQLGAAWKLVLGVIFVLLICFLRRGLIGAIDDLYGLATGRKAKKAAEEAPELGLTPEEKEQRRGVAEVREPMQQRPVSAALPHHRALSDYAGPILKATGLTKQYGGLIANADIDLTVKRGELRGIIGPNGAGKSTFFKMLTCEIPPSSGTIVFDGQDITGWSVTDVCQLGLTKSYQVNQLFNRLTVRENLAIAALADIRGKFRLDMFRSIGKIPQLDEQIDHTADLVNLTQRLNIPV